MFPALEDGFEEPVGLPSSHLAPSPSVNLSLLQTQIVSSGLSKPWAHGLWTGNIIIKIFRRQLLKLDISM